MIDHISFQKTIKVAELLENTELKNEEKKISITFLHSDVDHEAKLAIIHNLLDRFDVRYTPDPEPGHEDMWEFIRGKLSVNLKLEKIQDRSLVCHPEPPPEGE